MALFEKLVIIHGLFEIIGMVQFLSNEFFWRLMSDCDNELLVQAEVMDGEVIPHTEAFSRWIRWGAKNIFSLNFNLSSKAVSFCSQKATLAAFCFAFASTSLPSWYDFSRNPVLVVIPHPNSSLPEPGNNSFTITLIHRSKYTRSPLTPVLHHLRFHSDP